MERIAKYAGERGPARQGGAFTNDRQPHIEHPHVHWDRYSTLLDKFRRSQRRPGQNPGTTRRQPVRHCRRPRWYRQDQARGRGGSYVPSGIFRWSPLRGAGVPAKRDSAPQTILDALGFDERDAPERSATESLLESIRYKHLLLVLDNCEHLVSACAELISLLLRNTEHVKILATSREVLAIPEEHVLVLDPLSMTDHRDPDRPGPAIELFESRASAALSGFFITDSSRDAARRVCTQLDGMPLAIELACARLTALSVEDLAERLDDRLALLTTGNRGGPSRHRSLHATVEWSYDLCTPQEQVLWARLSVFSEGFDLAAAESVCAGDPVDAASILDTITGLIGKSVLQRTTGEGRVRFKMLETIRHFGAGKLSDREKAELRVAHLRWCAELVRTARRSWTGAEQERVSARLRENRANLRSALQAALSDRNHETLHLASSLVATWFLWSSAFSVREHRTWVTEFLGRGDIAEDVVAKLNATLGLLQTMQGERVKRPERSLLPRNAHANSVTMRHWHSPCRRKASTPTSAVISRPANATCRTR